MGTNLYNKNLDSPQTQTTVTSITKYNKNDDSQGWGSYSLSISEVRKLHNLNNLSFNVLIQYCLSCKLSKKKISL